MPQPATQHPPTCRPELPWQEQVLIRLDEIIGLLDGIDTSLSFLPAAVSQTVPVDLPHGETPVSSAQMDFLPLLLQKAEELEP